MAPEELWAARGLELPFYVKILEIHFARSLPWSQEQSSTPRNTPQNTIRLLNRTFLTCAAYTNESAFVPSVSLLQLMSPELSALRCTSS